MDNTGLKPNSYHLNIGCHNCNYCHVEHDYDDTKYFCTFINVMPVNKVDKSDPLTSDDVDWLQKYYEMLRNMRVEPYGHCDGWKLRR